jgi:hypothetical protein
METLEEAESLQFIAPMLPERADQHVLWVVMGRKRGTGARNPHSLSLDTILSLKCLDVKLYMIIVNVNHCNSNCYSRKTLPLAYCPSRIAASIP